MLGIPAGYMAKRVSPRPDWLHAERVTDLYSVSGCVSNDFADWVPYWKHNGYWLFDSAEAIQQLARAQGLDLDEASLFFYEVHDQEFDPDQRCWTPFAPEPSFTTRVVPPREPTLEGYDVVSFYARNRAECSPLSCNGLAATVETNAHCLLPSFDVARQLLATGAFDDTEPGPFRIFAVHSVRWP